MCNERKTFCINTVRSILDFKYKILNDTLKEGEIGYTNRSNNITQTR